MRDNKNKEGNDNGTRQSGIVLTKKKLALLVLLILLLIAAAVYAGANWSRWFAGGNGTETESESAAASGTEGEFNPELDPNASDWDGTIASADDDTEESVGIKIPGYPSISIPAGEETVTMALLNPEGNPCYFTFTIVLKDTEEVLYQSGLVPPGQAITSVTLSRALEAGEYDAVIQITTTSLEDGSAMNGANVETVLKVQ